MSTEMTVHTNGQDKDLFLSLKSSQYDRKWHALVRDGHRSTAKQLSFSEFYTSKLRSLRASCWCFATTCSVQIPADYLDKVLVMLKTSLWANRTCVHTCGQVRAKCCQARAFCGELGAGKIVPVTCPRGLPGKVWQVLHNSIATVLYYAFTKTRIKLRKYLNMELWF